MLSSIKYHNSVPVYVVYFMYLYDLWHYAGAH